MNECLDLQHVQEGKLKVVCRRLVTSRIGPRVAVPQEVLRFVPGDGQLNLNDLSVHIPNDYISEGEFAAKIFDIGTLNLNGEFSGEHYDCIN